MISDHPSTITSMVVAISSSASGVIYLRNQAWRRGALSGQIPKDGGRLHDVHAVDLEKRQLSEGQGQILESLHFHGWPIRRVHAFLLELNSGKSESQSTPKTTEKQGPNSLSSSRVLEIVQFRHLKRKLACAHEVLRFFME